MIDEDERRKEQLLLVRAWLECRDNEEHASEFRSTVTEVATSTRVGANSREAMVAAIDQFLADAGVTALPPDPAS